MKKANYLLPLLLMLALLFATTAYAHDFEVDGIYYNINGTTATVTYKGSSFYDYTNEYSGSVIIPATVIYGGTTYSVTTIGDDAFNECEKLTSIVIPNSVTTIGDQAFFGCTGLTNINIPNSVTTIDFYAFEDCTGLTNIDIPNSVTSIGSGAFWGCSGLTSVVVASDNPCYDSRNNCNAIIETTSNTLIVGCKNTTIPNSVTSIGFSAFSGCTGLTSINIPNSVTTIGDHAFSGCTGLTNINIPNSVTTIDDEAFRSCTGLTNIDIPNSVISIGAEAFYWCVSLTNITFGNSVTTIGNSAFECSDRLTNVYCYSTNPPTCFNYYTFETYSATLHVPAASLAAYFTAPYWCNFENIIGDAVVPTGIFISNDTVDIQLNEQTTLTATVTPVNASNNVVSWYSTNTNIATVDNGTITTNSIGECDIIASCFGMTDTCHITVTNPIQLDQHEAVLLPNHMLILTPNAIVMPEGFIATSSDPIVAAARVMNGKVQIVGIKEGTTTITVASTDGTAEPATCLVTVYTESGDLNSDGFVNISDVTSLIDYLLGGDETSVTMKNADVNGDGRINIADVTSLIDTLLSKTE